MRVVLVLGAFFLSACSKPDAPNSILNELPPPPVNNEAYFSPELRVFQTREYKYTDMVDGREVEIIRLYEAPDVSDLKVSWFAKHWRMANSPSFWTLSNSPEFADSALYRMTLLPSFDAPEIMTVEVLHNGSSRWLYQVTSGLGGYDAGPVGFEKQIEKDKEETRAFLEAIQESGLVDGGTSCWPGGGLSAQVDGTHVIFEASIKGRYVFSSCGYFVSQPVFIAGSAFFREVSESQRSLEEWKRRIDAAQ